MNLRSHAAKLDFSDTLRTLSEIVLKKKKGRENMLKVSDYIDVKKKAEELGCNIPTSIALLPRNYELAVTKEDLIHESTTSTVRILWRQNNVIETPLEQSGEKFPCIFEHAFEWIGPTIFISAMLLSQNPHLVTITLNVISNHLTEWFRGIPRDSRKSKLCIVTETKSGHYKKIEYEGPPDGLKDLPEIIREVNNE
ncbi:MAG: hypothetical protein PWQ66_1258 [Petrotoga sp.]|nr:hypothetical protein [Petrotoga sp.]